MNDEHQEDKAAFPRVVTPGFDEVATGMTLRDYFAAAALQGLLAGYLANDIYVQPADCPSAYAFADAMIEARKPK